MKGVGTCFSRVIQRGYAWAETVGRHRAVGKQGNTIPGVGNYCTKARGREGACSLGRVRGRPGVGRLGRVSNLSVSLGHTGRRGVVLGHTLNTQTVTKTDEQKKVLSKFTTLCWAALIAILGCGWDAPV